ncbi:hypothetical protein AXG93_421s1200 [Marchantia polymorpha subsp. ruderalis]|uniref:Uncharacterized protein n=1 Tax=Marchantia polymorpha subsp. ruderalis TaxID=1480154 RepID=A0A176VJL6_MARPO|nr:hypothetical protein AXG93_421s1200 [Marchantia polymorpha subsp. ruderalis]
MLGITSNLLLLLLLILQWAGRFSQYYDSSALPCPALLWALGYGLWTLERGASVGRIEGLEHESWPVASQKALDLASLALQPDEGTKKSRRGWR